MRGLRHQRDKIPKRVVRAGSLRYLVVRLWLDRMNQIGKLYRVLNKEDRHIVAHQVPIAFVGVELDSEAAHITRGVFGAALTGHGREADEHRRNLSGFLERRGLGVLGKRRIAFEKAMRARAARMHDALGNALVVKVCQLLAQDEVFQEHGPTHPELQRILVIGNRHTLVGSERAA